MTSEQWRSVPGYENRYEASDHGRVRSLGFYSGNRWGTKTWRTGRILSPAPVPPHGHLAVGLVDGAGETKTLKVHRLVLLAFRGAPPEGLPNGLHKDDDPSNNYLDNLRWGTYSQNTYDSIENGTHVQARKGMCQLGHQLVVPNLVLSNLEDGSRQCESCHRAQVNARHDAKLAEQGIQRTRCNRGADGFRRQLGESWQDEAHRRYAHVMNGSH